MIARLTCMFVLSLAMAAQTTPASPRSTSPTGFPIAGTMVSSATGQPVVKANVIIMSVEHPEFVLTTVSDTNGQFAFSGLAAGKYSLVANAHGYRSQGFNQHGDFFTGIVVGPEYDAGNLKFRLVPDASIEGVVTDDDGEPVRSANVLLFQRSNDSGQQHTQQGGTAMTDDRGHYQFSHLSPGTYFVAVSARPWFAQYPSAGETPADPENAQRVAEERSQLDMAYPMTFYPASEDSSGAAAIVVHAGERANADVPIRAVPAVHLHIKSDQSGESKGGGRYSSGFPQVSQRIFDGTVVAVTSSQGQTLAADLQEFTGIAPGHYLVQMPGSGSGRSGRGWYKEMDLSGTVDLDTSESPALASVTGALVLEGGSRPSGKIYVLLMNRISSENFTAEVSPKGTFDFGDAELRPGTYDVALNNAPNFQVKSLLAKGAHVSGNTVEISGSSVQLGVTAMRAVPRIDGTALRNEKPFAGAMVVLVPRDPASNWTLFRRDQSDSDGTFTLREVLPGPYTVIALENGWDLDWASPAALQPYLKNGTPIDVPSDPKLRINVQVQ